MPGVPSFGLEHVILDLFSDPGVERPSVVHLPGRIPSSL
jgi:hypothetical protein